MYIALLLVFIMSIHDLKTMTIPYIWTILLMMYSYSTYYCIKPTGVSYLNLYVAIVLVSIYIISTKLSKKEWIGGADILILISLAVVFPLKDWVWGLYYAICLAGVVGGGVKIVRKNKQYLPFAPFIFLGFSIRLLLIYDV